MRQSFPIRSALLSALLVCAATPLSAQQSAAPTDTKPPAADVKPLETPAQIELLETRIRFETSGDYRKEVHLRARINSELGVRQFSQLKFDYDRAFQKVEFPLLRITHASGGTADILPSAITDNPNPAVAEAPAYQDVRVKSVRILGLAPSDILEYRVVTTVMRGAFAPGYFVTHDFADGTLVSQELFEIDLPAAKPMKPTTSPAASVYETEAFGEGPAARLVYRWSRNKASSEPQGASLKTISAAKNSAAAATSPLPQSDIAVTSLVWTDVPVALQKFFRNSNAPSPETKAKAEELTRNAITPEEKLRALYDFVSKKTATVDLPLGATGYRLRESSAILSSGYATSEEKAFVLSSMARAVGVQASPAFLLPSTRSQSSPAVPTDLTNVLVVARLPKGSAWLDPSVEVAPFGMVASSMRGKSALLLLPPSDTQLFERVSNALPFAAMQRVNVDASLNAEGMLTAKVHYTLRGDSELLLRVTFHQSPREKWKEVAQLMSLSDGFRGKILSASASDPYDTRHPFSVDYEITQPKFVDWSKKPVRIPALLPALGLPDAPAAPESGAPAAPIELGTPLNVDTKLTLRLPSGMSADSPTGTSVERDYAAFTSHYAAEGNVLFASRHINFIRREVPAARTVDYAAFLHAVQTDQAQLFTLAPSAPGATSAQTASAPPPKP